MAIHIRRRTIEVIERDMKAVDLRAAFWRTGRSPSSWLVAVVESEDQGAGPGVVTGANRPPEVRL